MDVPHQPDVFKQNEMLNVKVRELQRQLEEQRMINNDLETQLQVQYVMPHHSDDDMNVDIHSRSELQPLSAHTGHESVSSEVNLAQQVRGGAITINICNCYSLRIYLHYWIWQLPLLLLNIILYYIWHSTYDDPDSIELTQLAFLAVCPVFLAALVRDKMFLWLIYWIVKHLYCCTQYGRYHSSRLADCIGGLHASFGITALIWNTIYFHDCFIHEQYQFNAITITALCIPVLLALLSASASPCFRFYYHNSFEIMHRYFGWTSLSVLVTHICFVNLQTFNGNTFLDLLAHITSNTPSIFAFLLVVLTLYPWLVIHRIKGKDVEIIPANSGQSTAFIFPIWSPMGAVCKLSLNWIEFHVMGITPMPYDATKGHRSLVLIKSLGDWTGDLTKRAKLEKLDNACFWIHRIKPPNFSQGLFNWNRVFALATGAGIAPLIPYVVNPTHYNVQISLVWVARDHANNYPEFIIDILKPLPDVVMYDTTKMKRPDLCLLTVQKAKKFKAEAVFIVANPLVAYDVANYVNKNGIPVFASNFDV
eukprot:197450_1